MRTIHELLKLTYSYIEKRGFVNTGICNETFLMVFDDIISKEERYFLFDYIMVNPPENIPYSFYHWRKGLLEPRLDWLKEHIELTKNNKK